MMKAVEVSGLIDEQGQLSLDEPVQAITPGPVRVIILYSEVEEPDLDDTPVEEVKASLRRALQQAVAGERIPLAQLWEDAER